MFNSLCILILKLNDKEVTHGNYIMAVAEFAVTVFVVAIICNT